VAESAVDFVEEGIVLQTIGPDGLKFTPFLLTLFTFILTCNIWGLIPGAQMPVNARIALPVFMALLVYVIYHAVGVISQGPLTYLKNIAFMPGVPKVMYILLTPIELVTKFISQPLSMAVRLFANMLAGHLLLVSFAVITAALATLGPTLIIFPFSFGLLVFLTTFEVLVAFLQAYIFTILAAVYIADAMHPAH
jgi:F-type H+-transporting ATPase subunit a